MSAFRSSAPGKAQPPQSIEAVRQRARHRLIGAAVLVLLGVIGFPLVFDTEPRPMSIDIPIEIPAKTPKAALPAAPAAKGADKLLLKPVEPNVAAVDGLDEREALVSAAPSKPAAKPVDKPSEKPAAKLAEKVTEKPAAPSPAVTAKTAPDSGEAERARALLEGRPVAKPAVDKPLDAKVVAGKERAVVQVGAFAEAAGAREVRSKLERAGLKTYIHVAQTPQGPRIRVRLGPFDSRAEAEKAAVRVKALGLPAAILTL